MNGKQNEITELGADISNAITEAFVSKDGVSLVDALKEIARTGSEKRLDEALFAVAESIYSPVDPCITDGLFSISKALNRLAKAIEKK